MLHYTSAVILLIVGLIVGGIPTSASESDREAGEAPLGSMAGRDAHLLQDGAQSPRVDASVVREAITVLDVMTEAERQQLLPWFLNAIAQQSDPHVEGELTRMFREALARLAPQEGEGTETLSKIREEPPEESPNAIQERESFEALLRERQTPPPSDAEIRKQIDELTFNPKQPGIALTQAMDLADVINRIQGQDAQETLRGLLQDKIAAMQAKPYKL